MIFYFLPWIFHHSTTIWENRFSKHLTSKFKGIKVVSVVLENPTFLRKVFDPGLKVSPIKKEQVLDMSEAQCEDIKLGGGFKYF